MVDVVGAGDGSETDGGMKPPAAGDSVFSAIFEIRGL
jgi:hypothetical protein